jgi:hypothetical protein
MSAKFKIINLALRRLGQNPIVTIGEDTENYRKVNDIYDLNRRSLLRLHPWSFAKKEVALSRVVSTTTLAWVTATAYAIGDYRTNGGYTYKCLIAHTSGTFATDLAAAYWLLSTDYETPALEDYAYTYQLPADFLRLNKTSIEPDYTHKIKGRKLYSNSDEISIEYGYDCKDPDAWVTSHAYIVGDYVLQSNTIYYCLTAHTSGVFATDLAADKWVEEDIYDASFTDAFATSLAYDLCMPITKDAKLKNVLGEELVQKLRMAKSLNGQEVTPDESQNDTYLNSRY